MTELFATDEKGRSMKGMKVTACIITKLNQMYETLDNMQEIQSIQDNPDLMNELGEIMGHIDNAIDIINNEENLKINSKERMTAYNF